MTPIEQIKAAIRFDGYAGRYLEVKAGKALCPFHHEKSPSFRVYEDHFYCFGCGAGGDLIRFAREYHGLSMGDAIRLLASEAGVPLAKQAPVHPYDALRAARQAAEAEEWHRLARRALIAGQHRSLHVDDYADAYAKLDKFRAHIEAMSKAQILAAYSAQRTPEQGAQLRASLAEQAKPTIEKLVREFLTWSR